MIMNGVCLRSLYLTVARPRMKGDISLTPGTFSSIAWASSEGSFTWRGATPGKLPRSCLGETAMKVAPTPWSCCVMVCWNPWTMETTATTAATPMMIPRVVSIERIRLARRAAMAMRKFSRKTMGRSLSGDRGRGRRPIGAGGPGGGLVGGDLAVAQGHLAPGVLGDVRLVGDQDHGVARPVELVEELHDLLGSGRVEVAGGLVGEQDGRLVDQGAGDGHALALAARQLVGLVGHARAEAHLLQGPARPLLPLGAREAGVDQRQLDVVQGVGAGEQVEGLEDEADLLVADPGQLGVVELLDGGAVEDVAPGRGGVETADEVHQRRLAAARGAHDGHVLPPLDRQIDAVQGVDLLGPHVVDLVDVAQLDQHHHFFSVSCALSSSSEVSLTCTASPSLRSRRVR